MRITTRQPPPLPAGVTLDSSTPRWHYRIRGGALVVVQAADLSYRARLITGADVAGETAALVGDCARGLPGETGGHWSVKVLGPEPLASAVATALRRQGAPPPKVVSRPCVFEAAFDGATGRLRVTGSERIRVLVVDDSKTVRRLLVHLIGQDPVFQVVGEAARAQDVAELVRTHQPDVMTLDLDMPEMNGVELLRQLLPAHPLPVLVISSLRQESSPLVFAALEAGAVDYLHKPAAEDLAAEGREITHRLRVAANARVMAGRDRRPLSTGGPFQVSSGLNRDRVTVPPAVIAIGSSTGGTEALKHVLPLLPPGLPPVVIAQHIPAVFSAALAARLAELSAIRVCEVRDGQELLPSHAYIAPGGRQFRVVRDRGRLLAAVGDDAAGELYRPSVNHLYRSIAAAGVAPVIAVQLTGMGDDGIDGLWALRQQGGLTCLAQDEESSVVWGMPGEAVRAGLADAVLALDTIAAALIELSGTEAGAGSAALGRNAPPGAGGSLPRRA